MDGDFGKVEHASMLYDFYGCLLNASQREVMALYHEDDMSLSEIAGHLGQSRQAVHYTLKRAEKSLESFEEKLGLIETYKARQRQTSRLAELISQPVMSAADKAEASVLLELLSE